ncbi:hypothetical protein SAMN04487969_105125 [Paenibacillus algorifonticola]|uniref:Uncharacterized protein n=1 Tax=Paenibacillus algorifonticola TaxID=684063 RepID=A0A1I2CKU7_9BACL|nr:hypothetical protein SAMN04487969_105125 [Paenibacillus algorifonticola]
MTGFVEFWEWKYPNLCYDRFSLSIGDLAATNRLHSLGTCTKEERYEYYRRF